MFGGVLTAGLGQNVARQVGVKAGIPYSVPAYTVNMVCGSGLRAVSLAAQLIRLGDCDVIVAGGTENMSRAPYAIPGARWGQRMGNGAMVDTMINDALTDAFSQVHMGITAENIAGQWGITRQEQDAFALASQQKAEAAIKAGCQPRSGGMMKRFSAALPETSLNLTGSSPWVISWYSAKAGLRIANSNCGVDPIERLSRNAPAVFPLLQSQ